MPMTSWTTSFVPSGTPFSRSRRKPYSGNPPLPSPRRRVLKHFHGLWKGTPPSRKRHLASDPMLRRVSSTISIPGAPRVTLASRPSPTPSSFVFSPPPPTTPASLPSGVDTDPNPIKLSEVEPRSILSNSSNDLSPTLVLPFSGAPAEPASAHHSPLPRRTSTSTSLVAAGCSNSGHTLDAATRLQDFRALVDELRATLLHHDSKEFDTRNCAAGADSDEEERERLLRLLEDVMRKVQQLAENDLPYLAACTMTAASP